MTRSGQEWDGDSQCQLLMFSPDARLDHTMADMEEICYSLKCRAPGRRGYYRAGPALEGTPCGTNKICHQGEGGSICDDTEVVMSRLLCEEHGQSRPEQLGLLV